MPRATRSKKIVIAEDDTDIASQVPLPDTPRKERPALAEISLNLEEEIMTVEDLETAAELKSLKAAYKTAIGVKKTKKGKGKKAGKKALEMVSAGSAPDVVDDEEPAVVSLATEGARQILSSDEGSLKFLLRTVTGQSLTKAEGLPCAEEERSKTPPSPAVCATRLELAKTYSGTTGNTEISTSPRREEITTLETVEKASEAENSVNRTSDVLAEDSFVEQITARSPAKPVSRIEDSVEELDKMEEAIEALGQAALAVSPSEPALIAPAQRKAAKAATKPLSLRVKSQEHRPNVKAMVGANVKAKEGVKRVKSSSALCDAIGTSEGKVVVAKKPVKRPASLLPPKEPVKSAKPPTKPAFELPGEAVARKLKEQREARKAQRESSEEGSTTVKAPAAAATRVRSAKQPTKPTFELPGEALSRKKREAHEARLKAQEEEERKRREFKAKPPRKSVQPDFVPRENVASLARKNQIVIPETTNRAPRPQRNSTSVSKRVSVVGVHRPSILALNVANMSAPRAPGPASPSQAPHARKFSTTSGPSMSGLAMQRTVSASEAQLQRQRAKDIYMRDAKALEEAEREKRVREAAAKKSRLEAAERGRQASREWAEKQRAKKAAEGDHGLSAGYGPGGQLGLQT